MELNSTYFTEAKPTYLSMQSLFQTHRGWAMLRSRNYAPLVSFFYKIFIDKGQHSVEESELASAWAQEIISLRSADFHISDEEDGINLAVDDARATIRSWASPSHGYLRAKDEFINGENVRIYDIEPTVVQALRFVEDLHRHQSVGAETRIQDVFRKLSEAYSELNPNADDQLRTIDRQIEELEQRRRRILIHGAEETDMRKAREKILSFKETAAWMSRDFEQLREDFKILARQAQRMRLSDDKFADSLSKILDVESMLYDSDPGKSFKGYQAVANNPVLREQFERQMNFILEHPEVRSLLGESLRELRRMPDRWHREVFRTLESVANLSAHIKSFMVNYKPEAYKALMSLVEDTLKTYAMASGSNGPIAIPETLGIVLDEHTVAVSTPMEKRLFSLKTETPITQVEVKKGDSSSIDVSPLAKTVRVNEADIRLAVDSFFQENKNLSSVTAAQVMQHKGIRYGTEEVLAYLKTLSARPEYLEVSRKDKETITVTDEQEDGTSKTLQVKFDLHRISAQGWAEPSQEWMQMHAKNTTNAQESDLRDDQIKGSP